MVTKFELKRRIWVKDIVSTKVSAKSDYAGTNSSLLAIMLSYFKFNYMYIVIEMQGLMQLQHKAIAAFDPEGLIFAAGVNSEHIKLYDLRSYDKVTPIVFTI